MKAISVAMSLAFCSTILVTPTFAQTPTTRALLSTFCDPAHITGDTCTRAKGYPASGNKAGCDVRLLADRFAGRFVGSGAPLLVVNYESGCESRASDDGGSAVFELANGKYGFAGFQPGARVNECVVVPRGETQDSLVCLAGHMGQGYLEGRVVLMSFTREVGKGISIAPDFLLEATDSTGAHGANVITCKATPPKYFELSKLGAGPRRETVAFDATLADADIFRTACGKGFPKPKEVFGTLSKGDAFVPPGREKKRRIVLDLVTRKVVP